MTTYEKHLMGKIALYQKYPSNNVEKKHFQIKKNVFIHEYKKRKISFKIDKLLRTKSIK